MWIIKNNIIPVKGFAAMNILGLLFVRKNVQLTPRLLRHEKIHSVQQYEIMMVSAILALIASTMWQSWWYLLIVVAMPLLMYVLAWLIALVLPPYDSAYKDSPFEREAKANEINPEYLVTRKFMYFLRYIWIVDEKSKGVD